jgi:hypothetical protein
MTTKRDNITRRILVLGSANHSRLVTAYLWDKLPRNLNVSDFDTVILNFTPFQNSEFAQKINVDFIPDWRQFARLIFSDESEVIAIGSPMFQLGTDVLGTNSTLHFDWWLPFVPLFIAESGAVIKDIHPEFNYYFALVRHWSFYLHALVTKPEAFVSQFAVGAHPQANSISVASNIALATTRFQRPIGLNMRFYLNHGGSPMKGSGPVYWLPEPTEVTTSEAIDLILRERYGFQFERTPPTWITEFPLPSQEPIVQEIGVKELQIVELTSQLAAAKGRLVEASKFQKLLYEQGEDVLEPIVRAGLRELGANVDEPKQRGREDGRLIDPSGRQGMLEVKGRSGNLRLSDVRELDNWVRDALVVEGWESKGVLIVNLQCDEDPRARREFISTNCAEGAIRSEISILTTGQLFQALVADRQGRLNRKHFWDEVFLAKGLCSLPDYNQRTNSASQVRD